MFDYQAGEKYRLTLIMVGIAGLIAGMFFTLLLMPTPQPIARRVPPAYANDPDITGRSSVNDLSGRSSTSTSSAMRPVNSTQTASSAKQVADPIEAKSLMESWLPLVWDLSAASAKDSQEKAISYMTTECAANYRKNIWTPDIAEQISQSSVESDFQINHLKVGDIQNDGSVVVYVEGKQTLSSEGKSTSRAINVQYVVVQTAAGEKIAEIIEGKS